MIDLLPRARPELSSSTRPDVDVEDPNIGGC
jgi:hypothetical protein